MAFNLNTSRKPEYALNAHLIHENIEIFGIQCMYLYSERINEDSLVFRDFSHMKVEPGVAQQITILPEDSSDWGGDDMFNNFGFYNNQNVVGFISLPSLLKLYPNFLTETGNRAKFLNSLLVLPGGSILEITDFDRSEPGLNNLWAYSDEASSYKLTMKVYDHNLADDGVTSVKETIKLKETEIFEYDEEIDTSSIDSFFDELSSVKINQDDEGDKTSKSGGIFGSLS